MPSKSYRRGYRFEKEVQKWFEEHGFFVVRQGKSKFPDLIAIPNSKSFHVFPVFVECKYNKKPSKKEIENLLEIEKEYMVTCFFAIKKKGQRGFDLYFPEELLKDEVKEG